MSAAPRPVGPRAGGDYPTSLSQFLDWFGSDADCARYLERLRWPDGFSCRTCGHEKAWITRRYLRVCAACGKQTSLIAGTVFEGTRIHRARIGTPWRARTLRTSSKLKHPGFLGGSQPRLRPGEGRAFCDGQTEEVSVGVA
ncbi:MAG: transposase [Acidimicrobiales bacterium]